MATFHQTYHPQVQAPAIEEKPSTKVRLMHSRHDFCSLNESLKIQVKRLEKAIEYLSPKTLPSNIDRNPMSGKELGEDNSHLKLPNCSDNGVFLGEDHEAKVQEKAIRRVFIQTPTRRLRR